MPVAVTFRYVYRPVVPLVVEQSAYATVTLLALTVEDAV